MSRIISRLEWARALEGWPDAIPKPRPRGVKALGVRYEKAVVKQLGPRASRGQWWAFRDGNGPGLCQTDVIVNGQTWTAIFECKLTFTMEGIEQLAQLYLPVVELALKRQVLGVQVCRNIVPWYHGPVFDDLRNAVEAAKHCQVATLHWRGVGPLMRRQVQQERRLEHV